MSKEESCLFNARALLTALVVAASSVYSFAELKSDEMSRWR
jgi:hypothetical protein